MQKIAGITLIEVVVTVAMMGIIMAFAVPSFQSFVTNSQLKSIGEVFYNDMKYAHSEAVRTRANIYISVKTGAQWCYGLNTTGNCDCTTANSCQMKVVNAANTSFSGIVSATGLSSASNIYSMSYDGVRGIASASGTVTFTNNADAHAIRATIAKIGHVDLCSPNYLSGYRAC